METSFQHRWVKLLFLMVLTSRLVSSVGGQDVGDPVTFELYLRDGNDPERIWPTESGVINSTSFDPCKVTVLAITGYLEGRDNPRSIFGAKVLTNRTDYNIILVNYDNYIDDYLQAVTVAGGQIAAFLEVLCETYTVDPANIILLGFSLGTHVSGYASSIFRVGRILAIDPAGPIFDLLPDSQRLDKSDTDFLYALHTSDVLGTTRNDIGHVNFIVNGGTLQPQCALLLEECNHGLAVLLFNDSLITCEYHFRQCSSYLAFKAGFCNNNPTLTYGIDLQRTDLPNNGKLYFYDTLEPQAPYCKQAERTDRYFSSNTCQT